MQDARAIAEETARASYGRLLAWLSSRAGDVAAAEDALSDAFRAALETWPTRGVPNSPEAWLLTAARRKLIDGARRAKTRDVKQPDLIMAVDEAHAEAGEPRPFPDERLKLMFICAHPAIDAPVRTPLMLQTVLGLDAARIASAFLISPAAMHGRLVRAKRKIKAAGISFETPPPDDLAPRLAAVLDAIYAAYGAAWDDAIAADARADNLVSEAIYLARLLCSLTPEEPEPLGLLSLILHAEARRPARRADGRYIALNDQDTALWDLAMIDTAEKTLAQAWRLRRPGRFQLEAAIQSAHVAAKRHGIDTRDDIIILYDQLVALAPTVGAIVSRAAALAAAERYGEALKSLNDFSPGAVTAYQPYWAVRAHILAALGAREDACAAYDTAIGLSEDPALRKFLTDRKAQARP